MDCATSLDRGNKRPTLVRLSWFQSAPGDEAGGDSWHRTALHSPTSEFQSAPGDEAGGDGGRPTRSGSPRQFQSAPGDEAGGDPASMDMTSGLSVSIRPRR